MTVTANNRRCRSPHGAERNAGTALPDFAALHPGYKSFFALLALMMVAVLADRHPPGLPDEMQ
jgi:hypothetical protein